jgi:thiol-disulfide isomerase/thioredoxin
MRSDWSKAALALKNGNEEEMKRKLLASEEDRAAAPLGLRDLAGRPVTLEQFRGKPLILSFWATWCGFCRGELADLTKFHAAHPDSAAVLAVSTDRDKGNVGPFAERLGIKLPIAISDGTNEDAYSTESIPQLYVLDSNGHIRFHLAGYEQDGLFLKRVAWMLDALEPPASATAAR